MGDRTLIDTMQGVNVAILNPLFAVVFGGSLVLIVVALALLWGTGALVAWITVALVLYVVCLAVTGVANVPLNNALDAAGNPGGLTEQDAGAVRTAFERRWVAWNWVRSATTTGASPPSPGPCTWPAEGRSAGPPVRRSAGPPVRRSVPGVAGGAGREPLASGRGVRDDVREPWCPHGGSCPRVPPARAPRELRGDAGDDLR